MSDAVLVTIPYSHYCEKARWALDRAGVGYREEPHLPLVSRLAGLRRGVWTTVPVLVAEGSVIPQSAAILAFADARASSERRLYPERQRQEIEALERHLDRRLGPHARRWAYGLLLGEPWMGRILRKGQSPLQAALVPLVLPLARRAIRRTYRITPETVVRSKLVVDEVFAELAARLSDGRPFLCGDRLTAADVAFGALATAVVFPDEHERFIPRIGELPEAMQEDVRSLRATPAGELALRLYREHRAGR